jgi:RNA polymerase sigma-70 factor, ECF subfamily
MSAGCWLPPHGYGRHAGAATFIGRGSANLSTHTGPERLRQAARSPRIRSTDSPGWPEYQGVAPSTKHPPPERTFRALYDAELPYVLRSLRRLGVSPIEAEDLAHDVFVVVHRRWDDYDRARPVRPWLFGIALRTASRALDRHWRRFELALGSEAIEAAPAPEGAAEDARDLLLRALAELEIDQRVVCILHDLDGQAAPEIAAALELPVNTVYSRLRVGRARLAEVVRRLSPSPKGELR